MTRKELVSPVRRRKLPEGFGWVDHRLVRENAIERFGAEALALYLFLITVGDEDGVSWYSDATIMRKLNLGASALENAREELLAGGLVAYRRPHYQVLEFPNPARGGSFREGLKEALRAAREEERRQPEGTEGLGVSLHPAKSAYRRGEDVCDALSVGTIIEAMAGGAK